MTLFVRLETLFPKGLQMLVAPSRLESKKRLYLKVKNGCPVISSPNFIF